MSPMKMIEVFAIPSLDLESKLFFFFLYILVPLNTLKILNLQPLELTECVLGPFKGPSSQAVEGKLICAQWLFWNDSKTRIIKLSLNCYFLMKFIVIFMML